MQLIYALLIGLVAGWLAGLITQRKGFGLAGNLVLGVLGSVLGSLLFGLIGLKSYSTLGSLVTATIGALITLFLVGTFLSKRR